METQEQKIERLEDELASERSRTRAAQTEALEHRAAEERAREDEVAKGVLLLHIARVTGFPMGKSPAALPGFVQARLRAA